MMKMNDIQQQLKTLNTTMEGKMNEILKNKLDCKTKSH